MFHDSALYKFTTNITYKQLVTTKLV